MNLSSTHPLAAGEISSSGPAKRAAYAEPPPIRALQTPPLTLHLFALGLGVAVLCSDLLGLSELYRASSAARSLVLVTVPLALAALGLALSTRLLVRRRWASLALMTLYAPAVGALCGEAAVRLGGLSSFRSGDDATEIGAKLGLVALPLVATVWWRASRVGTSPAGSLMDRSDRRAPWVTIAAALSLPQIAIAVAAKVQPFLRADQASAVGLLSLLGLATCVLFDVRAARAGARFDLSSDIEEVADLDEVALERNVARLQSRKRWGLVALVLCAFSVGVAQLESGDAYALLTAGPG